MEPDAQNISSGLHRRKRLVRSMRDKTPDTAQHTSGRHRRSDDDSVLIDGGSASNEPSAQVIRMQLRPPGTLSAHESKILSRRDKSFANAAARSHSQPRQAERLSSPEALNLIKAVKRRSSSPYQMDQDSIDTIDQKASKSVVREAKDSEKESRLEQNLRRFEEERKRFEAEKRQFEREKREYKIRHKGLHDHEERKRLLQNYRKLSDNIQKTSDSDKRTTVSDTLRTGRTNLASARARNRSLVYGESSTQFSSSEADAEDTATQRLANQLRRHGSAASSYSARIISRGPPPEPPKQQQQRPEVPARRSVSRNNSLSPIRPQRRSKTPEQRAEIIQKLKESSTIESTEVSSTALDTKTEQSNTLVGGLIPRTKRENSQSEPAAMSELRRRRSLEERKVKNREDEEINKQRPMISEISVPLEKKEIIAVPPLSTSDVGKGFLQTFFAKYKSSNSQVDQIAPYSKPQKLAAEVFNKKFLRDFLADARCQWQQLKADYPSELVVLRNYRRKCIAHTIMLILLCGFGGLMFRYTEGTSENIYKCEVRKVKRDFIENLWTVSHNMREDDWKALARQKLRTFEEELYALQELGMRRFPGQKSWNFVNCILYCWTVITTIGYGHITPKTTLGRSLTIIYAIIGVPIFLILLTDFGKLFTRAMKFLWAYVRRLYYTGTCRKIRKQQQVRDAISGFEAAYDLAVRRPSQFFGMTTESEADIESQANGSEIGNKSISASHPETPTSPEPETYEIDDEFNLPVSVASVLLVSYIIIGAFVYTLWEDWTYFEAFYFVFISMSTIGFGDFVPNHPIFMMCSILYLVFGLALTSMFINVVQIKLSDTFKHASAKISATIGLNLASEAGDENASHAIKTPSEIASIHETGLPQGPVSILKQRPMTPSTQEAGIFVNENSDAVPRRQVQMEDVPRTKL